MHYSTAGEEAMVHYRVERRGINPGQMHPAPLNTIPPNVPESNAFVVAITNHIQTKQKEHIFRGGHMCYYKIQHKRCQRPKRVECFFKVAAKTGTSNTHLIQKSDNSLIRRQTVNMML